MRRPERIDVLYIDECPNWAEAGRRVQASLASEGYGDVPITFRLLADAEEARQVPFAGSPTIVADGRDLFPSEGRTNDLACRIYLTPDGLAGLPTQQQIQQALRTRLAT